MIKTERARLLGSSRITEQVPNANRGMNESWIVKLDKLPYHSRAVLKHTPLWKHELAAFCIDRALGFNLMPEMSSRRVNGKTAVISEFIPHGPSIVNPLELNRAKCFSWITYDLPGNLIVDQNGKVWALDREGAFADFQSARCPKCQVHWAPHASWSNLVLDFTEVQDKFACPCGYSIDEPHLKGITVDRFFSENIGMFEFLKTDDARPVLDRIKRCLKSSSLWTELQTLLSQEQTISVFNRLVCVLDLSNQ